MEQRQDLAAGRGNGGGQAGHLLFLWSPQGYEILERPGTPPAAGAVVVETDQRYRVAKVGPSPLPGDRRRCAFLQPV